MPTINVLGNKLLVKKAPTQSDKYYILSKLPPLAKVKGTKFKGSPAQRASQAALYAAAALVRWSTWSEADIIEYENVATNKRKKIQRPAALMGLVISAAYIRAIENDETTSRSLATAAKEILKGMSYKKNKPVPDDKDIDEKIDMIVTKIYKPVADKFKTRETKENDLQRSFEAADDFLKDWMKQNKPKTETKTDTLSSRRSSYSDFSDFF